MLSDFIRFDLGSSKPLYHSDPLHPCETFTPYHRYLRPDAQPAKRGTSGDMRWFSTRQAHLPTDANESSPTVCPLDVTNGWLE